MSDMTQEELYDTYFEKNGDCKAHSRADCPFCEAKYTKEGGLMVDGKPARKAKEAPKPVAPVGPRADDKPHK